MSTTTALAGHQGEIVRRRVRQAKNNDGTVNNALSDLRDGIRGPMVLHSSDRETMARIKRWSRRVGWGLQFGTIAQVWGRVADEIASNGEVYVERVQVNPREPTDNGLRLQVWNLDSVDDSRGIDGHELDEQGVYAGTWFRGDATESSRGRRSLDRRFISDDDLIPIRICYEASAIVGYPLAAPALKAARILDSLALAEMGQAQLDASVHAIGLIEQPALFGSQDTISGQSGTFTDVDGNVVDEITPNSLLLARGIRDVKTVARDSRVIDYENAAARVAAGLRSTTERTGGTMRNASFSALRGAADQRRRVVMSLDRDAGLDYARQELTQWYVEAELLAGFVVDESTLSWLAEARETVNELQQVQALMLRREMGWIDDDSAIRIFGDDPEVIRERLNESRDPTPETRQARLVLLQGGVS